MTLCCGWGGGGGGGGGGGDETLKQHINKSSYASLGSILSDGEEIGGLGGGEGVGGGSREKGAHLNGVDPSLHSHKGLLLGNIIHEYDAMCSTVVCLCHRLEPLLSSSIPQLKRNYLVLYFEHLGIEVYPCKPNIHDWSGEDLNKLPKPM